VEKQVTCSAGKLEKLDRRLFGKGLAICRPLFLWKGKEIVCLEIGKF